MKMLIVIGVILAVALSWFVAWTEWHGAKTEQATVFAKIEPYSITWGANPPPAIQKELPPNIVNYYNQAKNLQSTIDLYNTILVLISILGLPFILIVSAFVLKWGRSESYVTPSYQPPDSMPHRNPSVGTGPDTNIKSPASDPYLMPNGSTIWARSEGEAYQEYHNQQQANQQWEEKKNSS